MAGIRKRMQSFLNKKRVEVESPIFLRNGGLLMEKLISLSNGRDDIHIRRFSIQEINKLTNNFAKLFKNCFGYKLWKGNLDGRPILVQIWEARSNRDDHNRVVSGTAISALMSHLKYTLKLIGCCTDLELPAQVYEYSGNATLTDMLCEDPAVPLPWGYRIQIARDVAAMVVYLHTSFPVAIIHRNLKPSNVLIDQNGDAKLFDFSWAIEIPQGESAVEDTPVGTLGFIDPRCMKMLPVSSKSDVYSFGVILLMLLTGKNNPFLSYVERTHLCNYIEQFVDADENLIDYNISQEVALDEFLAIKDLALSCTKGEADQRPEMIDVARRLHEIEKQLNNPSFRTVAPFKDNRNALMRKLGVLSNGEYKEISFRIFSSGEILDGTDNFRKHLHGDINYSIYKGYLDSCQVLVKKWEVLEIFSLRVLRNQALVEAAICSLMSANENISKFVGCCLEFEIPCLVFEDVGSTMTLYEILYTTNQSQLLSWGHRLKIASDIAAVVSHLQTAFPTPILHRDLNPSNVIISQGGEAKLAEFSLAIALPPGKSQIKDNFLFGTWGSLDPDYIRSKFISTKTDVYSFGVLLLALLTGMKAFWFDSEGNQISLTQFVEQVISEGQFDSLIDPRIFHEVEMSEFECLLDIARMCTRINGEDRPGITDVARLLYQMDKDPARVNS